MKYIYLIFMMYLLSATRAFTTNINILGTGLFLPYSLGVIGYIKKHIPIENCKLTGVSGGSWCSLLYALEDDLSDPDKIWNSIIGYDDDFQLRITNNMPEFHQKIETNLKLRYKDVDIQRLERYNISLIATRYDNARMRFYNEKRTRFENINDFINFCSCSSYIPYLSGVLMCKEYDNKYYMDGDIFKNRRLFISPYKTLNIDRHIWGRKFKMNNIVYSNKNISRELFYQGWNDTEKHKDILLNYLRN